MTSIVKKYSFEFYQSRNQDTEFSANAVIEELMKIISPRSVLDVGCGVGTWLRVFQEHGVQEVFGLEGVWVQGQTLEIPQDCIGFTDLSKQFCLEKQYDLAISLEVAEHIDESSADTFVENLTNHSKLILFSAAIPWQGGVHHVNEQWPEYWKEKFASRGYQLVDCIRFRIWNDESVLPWYKQNTFLFVKDEIIGEFSDYIGPDDQSQALSIVHPEMFLANLEYADPIQALGRKFARFKKRLLERS